MRKFIQIIADQKEELRIILSSGWVSREQEPLIDKNSNLAQIITGVRRSGKSTIAHRTLSGIHYGYVNFDDERLTELSTEDLDKLLQALYTVYGEFHALILDEIQNINNWHLFVNRLLRNGIHLIITGSNSKMLSTELATHLTGRYHAIPIFPFSFREYLTLKGFHTENILSVKAKGLLGGYFNEFLTAGSLPEIAKGNVGSSYAETLFNDIVTRDILFRHKIRQIKAFRDTARFMAGNLGSEISYNRIKSLFGLGSENTAKNFVNYLEEAYLILTLPKFSYKYQERVRNRKTYLIDNSFTVVSGLDFSQNTGKLLENVIYLELIRRSSRSSYEVFYYKNIVEVDFLLFKNRKVTELIQVSATLSEQKKKDREVRALLTAARDLEVTKLTIITLYEQDELNVSGYTIKVIPVVEWLLIQPTQFS